MDNEEFNSKILKIWQDYPNESGNYLPVIYPRFKKGGILFLGLNPSFSYKVFKKILKSTEYEKININEKLSKKSKDYDFLVWLEQRANEKGLCDYFIKFHQISNELGLPYQHIDLFFFRETSQKEAKKRIGYYEGKKFVLNKFALAQLEVLKEIVSFIEPKSIVVANAFASDIINNCDMFKINTKEFDIKGYDVLEIDNKKIPIIFSSMLTGQRALDNYSLKRLIWIIKRSVK